MKNWKKIPSTFKACSAQLEYMASIVDAIPAEDRETFDFFAREVFQSLEASCCDSRGQLTEKGTKKVDAVFPFYVKCIIE